MGAILARITSEKLSNLPAAISLVTGIPSCALYILVLYTIGRNWHKFDSSFWRLFFIRGLIHVYDFLNSFFFIRLGLLPVGHSWQSQIPSPVLAIGYFAWLYDYESQNFASIFILLTRLTSILLPIKHKKIWHRLLPLSILFTLIVPLFDTWPNLFREYWIEYKNGQVMFDNTTFTMNYNSDIYTTYKELNEYYTADNFVAIRSSVILLAVCTLLNVATIFFYAKGQNGSEANGGTGAQMSAEEQSVERRLLIFSVLNFLCQLLMALWWIITSACYGNYYICILLTNNQYWIKDIDALHSPPWLILWSSRQLREMVAKQIGMTKWLAKNNVPTRTMVFSTATIAVTNLNQQQQQQTQLPRRTAWSK